MLITYPAVYANSQAAKRPSPPFGVNRLSPQAKGLTAWWPILVDRVDGGGGAEYRIRDLASATLLKSSSTVSTMPLLTLDSQFGRVLSFDGVDDVITSFDPTGSGSAVASRYLSASVGIMSCWLRPIGPFNTDANVHNLESPICQGNGFCGINIGTRTGDSGDRIYFQNNDGGADWVSMLLTSGLWMHAAWRHAGGVLYGYVNGIEIGNTPSGNTSNLTATMRVGRSAGGAYHQCDVFDIRLYNFDIGPQTIYQMWHPATRWQLYKPINQQYVYAPPVRRNEVLDFELRRTAQLDFTLKVD